jgi:hypothetical protein
MSIMQLYPPRPALLTQQFTISPKAAESAKIQQYYLCHKPFSSWIPIS